MVSLPLPSSERILLVEGQDDKHVIRHLRDRHQPETPFSISEKGNIGKLLDSISPEIKTPGRLAVGILVDANDDLNARWKAITDRLRKANIQAPSSPDPTGTTIDGQNGTPRVGIWLMPDNISPGEIEDFVTTMIPQGDPVWPRSESYIDGIPEVERKFAEGKTQRAKLHAWLATRADPRKMGSAIGACDLNINGTLCRDLITWLTKLFA